MAGTDTPIRQPQRAEVIGWPVPRAVTSRRIAWAVHAITLAAAAAMLVAVNRKTWFFGDEGEFLHRLVHNSPEWFYPHNEQWTTVPLLVYAGLFKVFGMRTYWPYLGVLIAAHIAVVHLVWRIVRVQTRNTWLATGLACLIAFLGAGWENLGWAFQISFVGSLMFGLAALLSTVRGPARPVTAAATATFLLLALMCSNAGMAMCAVVWTAWYIQNSTRHLAGVVGVPGAAWVVWYAAIGHRTGAPFFHPTVTFPNAAGFVWTGVTASADGLIELPGAGVAVLALCGWWLMTRRHDDLRAAPAAVGALAGVVAFYCITAIGRAGLGVSAGGASRYVYVGATLLALAVAAALEQLRWLGLRPHVRAIAGTVAVVFICASGVGALKHGLGSAPQGNQATRTTLLAAATLPGAIDDAAIPEATTPELTLGDLRTLAAEGKLVPAATPAERTALLQSLLIRQAPAATYTGGGQSLNDVTVVHGNAVAGTNCVAVTADGDGAEVSIDLTATEGLAVDVSRPVSIAVSVTNLPGVADIGRVSVSPAQPVVLSAASRGVTVDLRATDVTMEFCRPGS